MWLQPHDLTISAADEAEGGESRARLSLTRVTTLLLFLGIMRGRRPWPWYCADVFLCLCEELLKVSNTSEHATHRGDRGHRGVKVDLFRFAVASGIPPVCVLGWASGVSNNNCWLRAAALVAIYFCWILLLRI